MKVGVIGAEKGLHETRFLRAFLERRIEAVFISFDELSQAACGDHRLKDWSEIDFFFGGPLHQGLRIAPSLEKVPFVAASYAFDMLYEAARDPNAAAGVRRLLGLCRGLLVDCEAVAKTAAETFGFSGPTLVRAWGRERTATSTAVSGTTELAGGNVPPSGPWIISVRNFTEIHGVMDVVRAFGYAAEKDPRLRLILAGDGPLKPKICAMIDDLRLSDRVKLLGRVPESEMVRLIRQADVYVSAALTDGTSISLLQALEAGVPVLLSNVGGNPEWVGRVDGAFLFEVGNWRQLGELMLAKTNRGATMRFDRSAVLARYADWKHNADDIIAFCLQVVGASSVSNRTGKEESR